VKNATIMCIEGVRNPAIVDEKFQTMVEYVEDWFFVKAGMALNATW
jgi:hypothetical protein